MKNILHLFLLGFMFFSCEKLDEPEILGTYVHSMEGCEPSGGLMFPCSRVITFAAAGVADVVGGDMISRTSYKIEGDKIKVEKSDQFGLEFIFKQLSDGSLQEESDKSIWIKQ
ncbi:MAG: hypothetical protein ABJC55_18370 [Algoriphagus sp.]